MSLEHQQINKSKFDCGQRVDKKTELACISSSFNDRRV